MKMSLIQVLIFFSLGFLQLCSLVGATDTNPNIRIVGGEIVKNRTEFAYQVSVRYRHERLYCSGSLISSKYVLTAAHCLQHSLSEGPHPPEEIFIVGGDLNIIKPNENTVTRNVSKIIMHQNFSYINYSNDIAILELSEPIIINNTTMSILKVPTKRPKENTECVVSGWGYTSLYSFSSTNSESRQPWSYDLRYVNIEVIEDKVCEKIWDSENIKYVEGMMCAGHLAGGKGICLGDTGSPLVCNGLLVGMVSPAFDCGHKDVAGLYADVSFYIDWIKDEIGLDVSNTICNKSSMIIVTICLYFLFKVL